MTVPPSFIRSGSNLHRANVELYQRHRGRDDGSGRCASCGYRAPCAARHNAALVITAAGEDPRWYDRPLPGNQNRKDYGPWAVGSPNPPPVHPHPSACAPGFYGFSVGNHGRRANVPYVEYER